MKNVFFATSAIVVLSAASSFAATLPGIGTYVGSAGTGSANGDVVAPPEGGNYVYVTTTGSSETGVGLGEGSETNGSELTTISFDVEANDVFSYYFNFITSDGAGYADYAYAKLNDVSGGGANDALIFTARTTTSGDTVPGFDLDPIAAGVTLSPASTAIVGGAPVWSELGGSSNTCFSGGCGYTGWVQSTFTIATAGTYSFTFGAVNWDDQLFDSGLAVAGLKINDDPIIVDPNVVPLPAAAWMLLAGIGGLAAAGRRRKAS